LRHRAKVRGDQSNSGGDMAIYRFFEDGGRRRHVGFLNFLNFTYRNPEKS